MYLIPQSIHGISKRLQALAVIVLILSITSCGYVLHPNRVGQTGGQVDPAILVLDAAGLLFGVIPGIVAFAVDISTGAIYLSPGEQSVIDKHKNRYSLSPKLPSFSPNMMEENPISQPEELALKIERNKIADQLSRYINSPIDRNSLHFHKPRQNNSQKNASIKASRYFPAQPQKHSRFAG